MGGWVERVYGLMKLRRVDKGRDKLKPNQGLYASRRVGAAGQSSHAADIM